MGRAHTDLLIPPTALNSLIVEPNKIQQEDDLTDQCNAYFPPEDKNAWSSGEWRQLQDSDSDCQKIIAKLEAKNEYTLKRFHIAKNGLLQRRSGKDATHGVIAVPLCLRAFILTRYHSLPVSVHKGRNRTSKIIKARYWWPDMTIDIEKWINACAACKRRKTPRPNKDTNPASVSEIQNRWQELSIDIVEAGATSLGQHKYILTVLDMFSRYVIAVPLKTKRAKDVANALFTNVFAVHGLPTRIRSDEGREFVNAGLTRLYKTWGIQTITTGGYRAWANPVERFHRYLNTGMTVLAHQFGEDWTRYLQAAIFSYNASVCDSTGYTPHYLMHGREPRLLEEIDIPTTKQPEDDIDNIVERMTEAYIHVRQQQQRVATLNRQHRKAHKVKKETIYEIDDQVMYWEPAQSIKLHAEDEGALARQAPSKWKPKWTGPHLITKKEIGAYGGRYSIRHKNRKNTIDNIKADKLIPYQPWSIAAPSTAPNLDQDDREFQIGTVCPIGNLIMIPLNHPWPFGIAKVTHTEGDTVHFDWYQSQGYNTTKPFLPLWKTNTNKEYTAKKRRNTNDTPVTDIDYDMTIKQEDIAVHSFKLTEAGYLPAAILKQCSDHPDIWWTHRKTKITT